MQLERVATYRARTVTGHTEEAAVLVPVVERSDTPHLLFTKRSEDLRSHPGQMSFPGGGREPGDDDLLATALREADEEIGLDPSEAEVVGHLDDIRGLSDLGIRPYVARVPDRAYEPDDVEVAEIAVLPLTALADTGNYESEHRSYPERERSRVHYFHVGGYTVWGLTGHILATFLELTTDWQVPE